MIDLAENISKTAQVNRVKNPIAKNILPSFSFVIEMINWVMINSPSITIVASNAINNSVNITGLVKKVKSIKPTGIGTNRN